MVVLLLHEDMGVRKGIIVMMDRRQVMICGWSRGQSKVSRVNKLQVVTWMIIGVRALKRISWK